MKTALFALGLTAILAATAAASPLDDIYACAAIADDTARLACFDAKIPAFQAAEDAGEVVAIDKAVVEGIERETFGYSVPSLPTVRAYEGDGANPPKQLTFPVKAVDKSRRRVLIELENGQIWQQTSGNLNYVPRAREGEVLKAIIKRGAAGSYALTLTNGREKVRGLKIKRIR